MSTLEEIAEAALKLPSDKRAQLVDQLIVSLDDEPMDPETLAIVERRIRELEEGKVQPISHEEIMARVRAKLGCER